MDLPGVDLQEVLEGLAERLGRGVFADSVDGRLIAYSRQDARADQARIASILARRVAPELRAWQNRHGITTATGAVRLPANATLGIQARLCVPIRHGGRCLGYLWVPEDGEPLDGTALKATADAAAVLARLLGEPADAPGERDDLVRRLLEPDQPGASARDRLTGLDPSLIDAQVLVCAAVPTVRGRDRVRAMSATEFQSLGAALPRALRTDPAYVGCFVTTGHVTALSRHSSHGPSVLDRALRRAARRPFAIGVSDPTPLEVPAVREAYRQARVAAGAAALDPALPRILPWPDAGPYRILMRTTPPGPPDPVLASLERAGDSAAMLRTLETYLDLGCDVQRTAATLHLHRTTVYYRLGRIAEILGKDLRDGLVRSHLHLALKARRLNRAGIDLRAVTQAGSAVSL
ncbi:hypothetical protein HNP84_004245 [Thermocatellispora tengchongensis]|uniref:PucR C-terminal helix-turn-helix domain-containing protein n=1 Tax=Thermocatellispora tengchongensis TaxID=1073253 RepID=A0A840P9C5_9ACTN|nr:helix-turn-helix domain-containing protein [Thermocatellispora tengchongensis]MBB5134513.1 hypothetical protein [Thermocatellispora tengchongensis]